MPRHISFVCAVILLAGCAAPAATPGSAAASAAPQDITVLDTGMPCTRFCEPTIAILPGGEWVLTSGVRIIMSKDEGATFEDIPLPPLPPGAVGVRGDAMVTAASDGTLFYSSLLAACVLTPCTLHGIEVARSKDLGASWSSLFLSAPHHAEAMGADRQWIVPGSEGTVCLHFQFLGPTTLLSMVPEGHEVRVSCSRDGGATFPPFAAASPAGEVVINGQGTFDMEGRLVVPYFTSGELHLARARAGASAFDDERLGHKGSMFPALLAGPGGLMHLGWRSANDETLHAMSADDGRSWSAPERLSAQGDSTPTGPWMGLRNGSLVAVWFVAESESVRLVAWENGTARVVASGLQPSSGSRAAGTDFPHLAVAKDGRVLVPFADIRNETTRLALI